MTFEGRKVEVLEREGETRDDKMDGAQKGGALNPPRDHAQRESEIPPRSRRVRAAFDKTMAMRPKQIRLFPRNHFAQD